MSIIKEGYRQQKINPVEYTEWITLNPKGHMTANSKRHPHQFFGIGMGLIFK